MRRWFLSYNLQDLALIQAFEVALRRKDAEAQIFFAPKSLRAGGYWLPEIINEIATATAFVLLVGEKGLGPWQVTEYYEALDRRVKEANFPIVFVLLDGQSAPGLPFLRQLHWIITPDPASEKCLAMVIDAAAGGGGLPGDLWRHTAPYRGLAAMTEADSDFFFGRGAKRLTSSPHLPAHRTNFRCSSAIPGWENHRSRRRVYSRRSSAKHGPRKQSPRMPGRKPLRIAANGASSLLNRAANLLMRWPEHSSIRGNSVQPIRSG